jgi:hypothetical protein
VRRRFERMVLGVLMTGVAFVLERRIIKALKPKR